MYRGLHSIGVGVSDMDAALEFYSKKLGFTDIMFDYTGDLPGMEKFTGKPMVKARVVMIANPNVFTLANSMIRLVQLLPPDKAAPIPEGIGWGEVGVAEVCIKVKGLDSVLENLSAQGCVVEVEPFDLDETWMYYTLDPDGGKVELLQSVGRDGDPEIMGVFHVGLGVSDLKVSGEYYEKLGFPLDIWDFEGDQPPMRKWFGHEQVMTINLLANFRGGAIEMVQHTPEIKDCKGEWGHLGAMDFSVETTNIELAVAQLAEQGIKTLSDIVTIDTGSGQWKYVYLEEPDGNYISLIEQRF